MTGRGWALLAIAGLAALCVGGLAGAAAMAGRDVPFGWVALVAAPSVACGGSALFGLAWWLSEVMIP